jgi:hypothetical protein
MSYVTTRRFILVSNVNTPDQEYNDMINITSANDVFDSLVDVRDSVTGEEGTLLCSHMCNFPPRLARQATWLAGCKPTSEWENDSRLALGYHPDHYIQWRIFKETNEIELYLTGGWFNPEATTVNYAGGGDDDGDLQFLYTDLPFPNCFFGYESHHDFMEDDNRPEPFSKSLIRLAKSVLLDRVTNEVTQETLNNFECLIHRLFNSGRIDGWTATVFPSSMLTRCLHRDVYVERIHWQSIVHESPFLDGVSAYVDGGYYNFEWCHINDRGTANGIMNQSFVNLDEALADALS